MTEEELTVLILDHFNWEYDTSIGSKYKNSPTIILGDLILAILVCNSLPKACEYLNIGYKATNNAVQKVFVPIFGKINGGNETWAFKLLNSIAYKKCPHCNKYLQYSNFGIDNHSSTGRHNSCSSCRSLQNAINYKKDNVQEAHKRSQEKHYYDILARNAEYRAERSYRTVKWADRDKIKEVYANCPDGLQVDHIIPLKGELVSGLHVDSNLQYLTLEENLKKSNKYTIE